LAPFTSFTVGSVRVTSLPMKILISIFLLAIGVLLLTASLYLLSGLAEIYKRVLRCFD
jgi:hypothetical protein